MYGSVYPNMSRHTSFRQRKSGSNNDNMKKMLSVRKCSTLSNTLAFPPFSSQVNPMPKCGLVQTKICITHSLPLLEDPAIITGSLEAPPVGQADTRQVGTLVVDTTTQTVEVKVEEVVMAVGHILLKAEEHLMGQVACPVLVLVVEVVVATVLEALIIPKVVHTVAQGPAVAQI